MDKHDLSPKQRAIYNEVIAQADAIAMQFIRRNRNAPDAIDALAERLTADLESMTGVKWDVEIHDATLHLRPIIPPDTIRVRIQK